MGLFSKRKEEKKCSCGANCSPETMEKAQQEKNAPGVKVLGGGCAKCNQLEAAAYEALKELGMDDKIHHVKDFAEIAAYGVMTTPALVIDNKVVSYGRVLSKDEAIELIKKVRS